MAAPFIFFLAAVTVPHLLNMPFNDDEFAAVPDIGNGPVFIAEDVFVDPDGRPVKCSAAGGSPAVNALACKSIMKRARFSAPLDDSGQAVYAQWRSSSAWQRVGFPPRRSRVADVEVSIKATTDLHLPMRVGVALLVSADGEVANCGSSETVDARLVSLACDQARKMAPLPTVGNLGLAVPYLRSASINFTADTIAK